MAETKKGTSELDATLRERIVKWIVHLDHTLPQAAGRANKDGYPLAALLIQTNLLEFHLTQLLLSLNLYVRKHASASQTQTKAFKVLPEIRTPREYWQERYTLGMLISELKRFYFPGQDQLVEHLVIFNKKVRRLFFHQLTQPERVMTEEAVNELATVAYELAKQLTQNIRDTEEQFR